MRRLLVLVGLFVVACSPGANLDPQYDVIVRSGTIYDGTGRPHFVADVALSGDRIAAIGNITGEAPLEIDGSGLAVAPGFINMLSWGVDSLILDGRALSDIKQGVTLEVFGEGWSMGPLPDNPGDVLNSLLGDFSFDVDWRTLGEYLEKLEREGVSPNVASFVGATTLRIHEVGFDDRPPTPGELARMQALARQAMEEGAMGLGSSLIYPPAFYADTEELIALASAVSDYGGMYVSHLRSEGNRLLESIDELIRIAGDAGVPAEIYHLKMAGRSNWVKFDDAVSRIERARAEGLAISANMYTYTAGSTGLAATTPPWAQDGGNAEFLERLSNEESRQRILEDMTTPTDEWENFFLAAGPDNILLVRTGEPSMAGIIGRTVSEVAKERGASAEATVADLILESGNTVGAIFFLMSEENVKKQLEIPWISFGSDGDAIAPEGDVLKRKTHPRAYGNFARLMGKYVREEKIISLEEAVRRLTDLPATNLKLRHRGRLAPDYYADIVLFDPDTITDRATYDDPHQLAEGVIHVFVNGEQVLKDGEHTGAMPGRVVRGPGWIGWSEQ